jgi:hypothetical protein
MSPTSYLTAPRRITKLAQDVLLGTPLWIRTRSLRLRKPLLYPLSYRGKSGQPRGGIRVAISQLPSRSTSHCWSRLPPHSVVTVLPWISGTFVQCEAEREGLVSNQRTLDIQSSAKPVRV